MRRAADDLLALLGRHLLDLLGRDARIDRIGLQLGVRQHQRIGRDDAARGDDGIVQQGSAHTDQAVVADDGAVDDGVVAHRHAVAQRDGTVIVAVQHGVVLHVASQ